MTTTTTTTTRTIPAQRSDSPGRQRLRAALTILGITSVTTALITLLAFGTGFQRQVVVSPHGEMQTEVAAEPYLFHPVEFLRYQ